MQEETYLRSEHQYTEEKLFGQAKDLLSAAAVYEADLDGLQKKIDRFTSLDSQNRSTIGTLPDIWLTENLKQPLDLVASLKTNISSELGRLAAELGKKSPSFFSKYRSSFNIYSLQLQSTSVDK